MTSILSMTLESMGKMRSTPWPKLILRTVKLGCAPRVREMTTPSNACKRSFSPSLIFTSTFTVSPGPNFGMSVRRDFASSFSIIGLRITFPSLILSVVPDILVPLNLVQHFLVFPRQPHPFQQIRPVPQCLCQRRLPPPVPDLLVVAVHQNFRHRHPAKFRRPRVMRIIQQSRRTARRTRSLVRSPSVITQRLTNRFGKRFLPRRILIADRARNQPGDRIHN